MISNRRLYSIIFTNFVKNFLMDFRNITEKILKKKRGQYPCQAGEKPLTPAKETITKKKR